MLAGAQAGQRLLGMHLRRGAKDDRIDFWQCQRVGQVRRDMLDAVLIRDLLRLAQIAADQRDDFDAVNVLDAVQVLDAESASAGQRDFDDFAHLGVFQNQVADSRVGRRYMVKTLLYADWVGAGSSVFSSITRR